MIQKLELSSFCSGEQNINKLEDKINEIIFAINAKEVEKEEDFIDIAEIVFIKTCHFLDKKNLLKDFDWSILRKEFRTYLENQKDA